MPAHGTPRILLAVAAPPLATLLTDLLEAEFYQTSSAGSAEDALTLLSSQLFDLLLLDVKLPDRDGFALCQSIRQHAIETPILMLSERAILADRVHGLMLGADDFLATPFHPAELLARIHALLRRARSSPGSPSATLGRFGEILLDFSTGRVERNGSPVNLAAKELQLLKYLAKRPDQVVSREELLTHVWGYSSTNTRTLDVHIACLRQKLERDPASPSLLLTVRGIGYQLCLRPLQRGT